MNHSNFWKGKRVLVTGGSGFIGSHLVELLLDKGSIVSITARSDKNIKRNLKNVKDKINIFYGDLMDYNFTIEATKNQDVVMNLAAIVGGIEYNMNHPASLFRTNMQMFMNVINSSKINQVSLFLTVSSACVYPRFCTIPTPENEGFKGVPEPTNEGYGWAKRMQEFLSKAYSEEYGMKIAIARPYNAYGPRDDFNPKSSHVIAALVKRVVDGNENPLNVWGSGNQSRSFLYVVDFARGLMEVAEKYPKSDAVNIGNEIEVTIKEVIETIIDLTGSDIKIAYDMTKTEGQPRRNCDTTKLRNIIGYKTEILFKDGLKETIKWYKAHSNKL